MSCSRRCEIVKAKDSRWYLVLGKFEYTYDMNDCTVYGPFATQEKAEAELDNYSNPGAISYDDSGTRTFTNVCRPAAPSSYFSYSCRRF